MVNSPLSYWCMGGDGYPLQFCVLCQETGGTRLSMSLCSAFFHEEMSRNLRKEDLVVFCFPLKGMDNVMGGPSLVVLPWSLLSIGLSLCVLLCCFLPWAVEAGLALYIGMNILGNVGKFCRLNKSFLGWGFCGFVFLRRLGKISCLGFLRFFGWFLVLGCFGFFCF